jgi:hypothetical protein
MLAILTPTREAISVNEIDPSSQSDLLIFRLSSDAFLHLLL